MSARTSAWLAWSVCALVGTDGTRSPPPGSELIWVEILHLILDKEVSPRLLDALLAPRSHHEALTGYATPQRAIRPRTVRDAQGVVGRVPSRPFSSATANSPTR